MNENINLTKILEGCPIGTEFYHSVFGKVFFWGIKLHSPYPITFMVPCDNYVTGVTSTGTYLLEYEGECTLFPSKEQRDWDRFDRFWDKSKINKFNINTLQPFDKILARNSERQCWTIEYYSFKRNNDEYINGLVYCWKYVIPYNKDTEHLSNTNDDRPDYYHCWQDE